MVKLWKRPFLKPDTKAKHSDNTKNADSEIIMKTDMDFKTELSKWSDIANNALAEFVSEKEAPEASIYKAMKYSIDAGGKRLRPVLAFAVCDLLNGDESDILPYACAIEMIHTYSLIHDDLPVMDNDDYRRGKLTNHKVFGEAIAILAGDALLNCAFETMLKHTLLKKDKLEKRTEIMSIIAKCSGAEGMIGGQVVDLESEGKRITVELLEYMHKCKTGALIKAPVLAAAILCGGTDAEIEGIEKYAEKIGLAFQIKDDIMDVEGNFEAMGKSAGKDSNSLKSTFISIYGLEKSRQLLDATISEAIEALDIFGEKAFFLKELAYYIGSRNN